jgi:hypothetical protein
LRELLLLLIVPSIAVGRGRKTGIANPTLRLRDAVWLLLRILLL